MALTNAERQARHRARIKEKLQARPAEAPAQRPVEAPQAAAPAASKWSPEALAAIDALTSMGPTFDLTPRQERERQALMADPLFPVPQDAATTAPRFMGWTRWDWREAPEEMIDFFDLRSAWDGWNAEWEEITERSSRFIVPQVPPEPPQKRKRGKAVT